MVTSLPVRTNFIAISASSFILFYSFFLLRRRKPRGLLLGCPLEFLSHFALSSMEDAHSECSSTQGRQLTPEERRFLCRQDARLVSPFQAAKLEKDAKKHWDLFYKRNETRFFKDRHWTTREFQELIADDGTSGKRRLLLEVGCGVGNLIFPLVEEGLKLDFYACDISMQAVTLLKANPLYREDRMTAFQADVTSCRDLCAHVVPGSVHVVTMVFVLSAIHPAKFGQCLGNLYHVLSPAGMLLFRDYGLYDMAQLRFKPGNKISENFYVRQDGTRTYYFSLEEVNCLFTGAGFEVVTSTYVHRRTVNRKEGVDVPRIFVQAKFRKPS